jgi:cytochrome c peroxidase
MRLCHMPQTGFQGAIESLNRGAVAQPGSVRTRFSLRKPPSAAYAAFSPPLFYPDKPGEAKCSHCFIGGNFWDLRATGLRLQSPTAMQAEGSPLNPTEMANPDPACDATDTPNPSPSTLAGHPNRGREDALHAMAMPG